MAVSMDYPKATKTSVLLDKREALAVIDLLRRDIAELSELRKGSNNATAQYAFDRMIDSRYQLTWIIVGNTSDNDGYCSMQLTEPEVVTLQRVINDAPLAQHSQDSMQFLKYND